jgi:LysM repeat protein
MIDSGIVEALNQSIDRLNRGGTVADCLRWYPQYASQLARLLEVGQLVRRTQADANEAVLARERQRGRFERALNQPMAQQRVQILRPLGRLVATLIVVFVLMSGGAGLLAENSLPGDFLYDLKLWTESARVMLTNYDTALITAFAARRIEEARQLVALRRVAEMTFTGTVQAVDSSGLWIEGLLIQIEDSPITAGSRVEAAVRSTDQGELIALQIRLIDSTSGAPESMPEPTSVQRLTQNAVITSVPSATSTIPTTQNREASPTTSESVQRTPSESGSEGRTECAAPPAGWVRYWIQPGDTLSALAAASGGSIDAIMVANCLEDARSIVAGEILFLPRAVIRTSTRLPAAGTPTATTTPVTEVIRPEPTRPDGR